MKRSIVFLALCCGFFFSCNKTNEKSNAIVPEDQFIEYIIPKGGHYANINPFKTVQYNELKFIAWFDNTAIYQTSDPNNQEDINKLFGFSDNNEQHQQYSARIGWNWARNALRLYAYVYNNGNRSFTEITSVSLQTEINCSIKINGSQYIFTVNNTSVEMPRSSSTAESEGYKLYPYFGGDETSPHDIHIWIKEI